MFGFIKERVRKIVKKVREVVGKPAVWGSAMLLSPTLVACYGPGFDIDSNVYYSAECEGHYVQLHGTLWSCEDGKCEGDHLVIKQTRINCSKDDDKCSLLNQACSQMDIDCRFCGSYDCIRNFNNCIDENQTPKDGEQASNNADNDSDRDDSCASDNSCASSCDASSEEPCNSTCAGDLGYYKWNAKQNTANYVACVEDEVCVQDAHFAKCESPEIQNE